ncbi:MAG: FAD-dependent oxidoreductase [Patescibacteria group bacterium]|nr:FAD-dependent oxidoreductase [Patescibacteria group bacterium]
MKKNIVVLGGGFGGLQAALILSKKLKALPIRHDYEVVLIDRCTYHVFTPLLYEIATTSKNTADYLELKSLVTYSLSELLKKRGVRFIKDEVMHIDLAQGAVHLKKVKVQFNYLVLALGSETNYFNIPGLKENSFSFKTFDEAIAIRDAIWSHTKKSRKDLRVVVGGGGSTGVELAGEIKKWTYNLQDKGQGNREVQVTIIEGMPAILPGFDARVIKKVSRRLRWLGVKIINNEIIEKIAGEKMILASGRAIPFDVLVWAGGVRAVSLTEKLPLKREGRGRVEIIGALECLPESPDLKIYGRMYAIGDIACIYNPKTKQPVPQVARAAITQGKVVAKNIIEEIKKENRLVKSVKQYVYIPKTYPYIIPVGGKFAVAKFGPFVISGFLGWVLKGFVELNYFISIMPIWRAFRIWLKGFWVFIQNDRLG